MLDLSPTIPIHHNSYLLSVAMFRAQQNAFDDAVGKSCWILESEVEVLRSYPEMSCDGARGTRETFKCGCILTMQLFV